jgi:hypothetical protein
MSSLTGIAPGFLEDKISYELMSLNKVVKVEFGKYNPEQSHIGISRLGRMVI